MENYLSSNLSRRQLLRILGLSTLSLQFGGCPRSRLSSINFWGTGTLDIAAGWQEVESLGIRVEFEDNGNDPGPVVTKLVDQLEFRVRHLSGLQGGTERELAKAGAIVPWDLTKIPNFDRLWPWAKDISYTLVDGERFGIPAVINADSIIYLPERTGHIDSYSAIFDPDLRGRTSMEDAWINSVIFAAIYLKENDKTPIEDPGNLTETELREVMRFLSDQAKAGQFRKLWNGWLDGVELVKSQQVWAMTGWEPIVYEAQRMGVNALYAVPREGYEGWSNNLVLHPGALTDGLSDNVHQLVNWQLGGSYGCELATLRGYVVPSDQTISHAELNPEKYDTSKIISIVDSVKNKFFSMKGRIYWQNCRPDNYQLYEEEWAKFRALF